MGKFILTGCRIFTGGADLTTNSNKLELSASVDDKEVTAFTPNAGQAWTEVIGGLASTSASGEGQWEALDPSKVDDSNWVALGVVGAFTATPQTANVGDLAWLTRMMTGKYQLGGAVGDVAPWSADWKGSWPLVRGQILHPPGTARTATGTGTALNLGALSATQALYVTLHVLSAAGTTPSITVAVESGTAVGMPVPTTRATFTAATALGGQTAKIPGAVTDSWWRVKWTISGTTPSFLLVAAAGIGPA